MFGLKEALGHLERALALWEAGVDAPSRPRDDELLLRAAELASQTGDRAARRRTTEQAVAVRRRQRGDSRSCTSGWAATSSRAASGEAFLAADERAVELAPARGTQAQARALAGGARDGRCRSSGATRRRSPRAEQALELARGGRRARRRAESAGRSATASALAYLGRGDQGTRTGAARASSAPEAHGDPRGAAARVHRVHGRADDARAARARRCGAGRGARRGAPIRGSTAPCAPRAGSMAMLAMGEWEAAEEATARALRSIAANYPHMLLMRRADLEVGRGRFDAARAHLAAAARPSRHDPGVATYQGYVAELALWEQRWTEADEAASARGCWRARPRGGARRSACGCARTGLRAQAELAALARVRGTTEQRTDSDSGARANAHRRALVPPRDASRHHPETPRRAALAEAERERARGAARRHAS